MGDSQTPEPGTTAEVPRLLLCGARLADGRTVDVRLGGGRIEAVGTAGSLSPGPQPGYGARVDLGGYLLLPAPAEPHAHHDSALTAPAGPAPASGGGGADGTGPSAARPGSSRSGSSPSASARSRPARSRSGSASSGSPSSGPPPSGPPSDDPHEVQRRTTEAALLQLGHGATALRSHVRIGDVTGLRSLEAVLQARRSLRGLADLTTVAVPRLLTGLAGAEELAMLRDALKMGAGVVGGCPDLDPDPAGYVDAVLTVAAEHGCAVDLHTDAADPTRLARLAAAAGGLRPGVSLGPCAGLARLPQDVAGRAADQLAAAGISVVALPQGCCAALEHGGVSGAAPVRLLRSAGVTVAAGSGALRDAANPVGRGDPLEAAYLLASRGEASPDAAYEAVSAEARTVMGLPEIRVEAGFPAELLAVRGPDVASALSLAYSRIVVHRGRVVARTSAVREYCDSAVSELDLPRQSQG